MEFRQASTPSLRPLTTLVEKDLSSVNSIIAREINSSVKLIPLLAGHLIDGGGKRIRPMLTLACAALIGVVEACHHNVAASIEFIHSATLLHDDVVDGSSLRRGRETANIIWGDPSAVAVGDFLLAQSFRLMIDVGNHRALQLLSRATINMAQGELDQLAMVAQVEASEDQYLSVIDAKTAELFAMACRIPAVLAGEADSVELALNSYGRNLGRAFQLIDDAIDYVSDDDTMGKAVGDDFREGKVTLPVILSFKNGTREAQAFWRRIISGERQRDDDALVEALYHLETGDAIALTLERARQHSMAAIEQLAGVGRRPAAQQALAEAALFSVTRTF